MSNNVRVEGTASAELTELDCWSLTIGRMVLNSIVMAETLGHRNPASALTYINEYGSDHDYVRVATAAYKDFVAWCAGIVEPDSVEVRRLLGFAKAAGVDLTRVFDFPPQLSVVVP